jgi:hypothetical protein
MSSNSLLIKNNIFAGPEAKVAYMSLLSKNIKADTLAGIAGYAIQLESNS